MNLVALTVCIFSFALVARVSAQSAEISFNRDVRPILSDRCFHCHGPDADNQVSEFRLDNEENVLADLGGYSGIVPEDLEKERTSSADSQRRRRRTNAADGSNSPFNRVGTRFGNLRAFRMPVPRNTMPQQTLVLTGLDFTQFRLALEKGH